MNKSIGKKLRELANIAYERELSNHLSKLRDEFDAWGSGKISSSELSDRIRKFHNGPARNVYLVHSDSKADWVVARGLNMGLIAENEVPVDVRNCIARTIETFRMIGEIDSTG